ncbi:MAG: photosynthetic reaction center cytochrome PufC [Roseovarius sp.]
MFPKWFDKWNRENPKEIYGPAIAIGVVGGAVFLAAALVAGGQPYATDSLQTGPRGTGMSVPEFTVDLAAPDPDIEVFLASTSSPIVPGDDAETADEARENVPPGLEDLTVENYDRLLAAMREWTGIPDLFEDPANYQSSVGYLMIGMTQTINDEWAGHVNANKEVGVTCYTCHRGQPVPENVWFRISPVNDSVEGWAANQNRVTMQSQYTSLPSDALEKYLLDGEDIAVHDLESRVAGRPGDEDYASIQATERTYSLMNYVSNSLGVNCLFCHNSRAFYSASGQITPQWATATLGIEMVLELNNTYLAPLDGILPEHRLGPVYADAPKAACATCHNGYQQPLQGTNVIKDWPELASTAEPDYGN